VKLHSIADELAQHQFFEGLERSVIDLVAGCGRHVVFPLGTQLFSEGEAADRFFVVHHGRVALGTKAPGRPAPVIDTVEEGEVLGWSWLFAPYAWHFDARAVSDVRAVAFDARCLRTKCDDDPRVGYQLMQRFAGVLVQRLQATRLRLLDLYGDDAR
jgi:CRP-like cAMP-binding protein